MNAGTRVVLAGLPALIALIGLIGLGTPALRAETADSPQLVRPGASREESWQRLRVGMSQLEVLRLLGEPGRTTRYYAFTRWEYPDALGRRVNFDEHERLLSWGSRAR